MTLDELKTARKVVGLKQVKKAIVEKSSQHIFLAEDAEARVKSPLEHLAREEGVEVTYIPSMCELGRACSIDVGAAAVAVLRKMS